jgi:hypothetical protein
MRSPFCWTAPLALMTLVIGCNTVDPSECWPNTSGGFGGSGTIPIGAGVGVTSGDFLSPPRKHPLDNSGTPNPCIQPQSSCNEKCLADYEAAAIVCGKIADATERKTCQDDAYANNKSCLASCQQSSDEKCKVACDKVYNKCMDNCKDGPCRDACFKNYTDCLRECDK